jgi:uncharacterized membrane protein YsdA (DUF1294 family)
MNATTAAVLAGGQPLPTPGGDFLPLVHYAGWALFALCLLGFVAAAATRAWRRDAPEKGIGLVLLGTVLGGTAGAVLGSVS